MKISWGQPLKISCWSCGEPRGILDEFCPQCGAGPVSLSQRPGATLKDFVNEFPRDEVGGTIPLPASTPAEKFEKPQEDEPNKPAEKPVKKEKVPK